MTKASLKSTANRNCPVCKKPSYSASGIHPQCAATRADRERKAAIKAAEEGKTTAAVRKNRCPRCGNDVPLKNKVCVCGRALR